jgi:hypothetical protein
MTLSKLRGLLGSNKPTSTFECKVTVAGSLTKYQALLILFDVVNSAIGMHCHTVYYDCHKPKAGFLRLKLASSPRNIY